MVSGGGAQPCSSGQTHGGPLPQQDTHQSAERLVLSPKANSKLEALRISGKFQPRNSDEASACIRPGAPMLDGQVTLDPVPHFLSTLKGVFWGLPRDKCPAGCPSTLCSTPGQACCGSDFSFSSGKPWVAGGCDRRASESHSGLLGSESGRSDHRSTHCRMGHFLWGLGGAQSSCLQAQRWAYLRWTL